MEKPKVPLSQLVYGQIVYWLSIIAALICAIGLALSIGFPDDNLLKPQYLFGAIWKGGSDPLAVWREVGGGFPGGNFWINNLNTWDGFMAFGFAIGCSSAGIGLLAAIILFFREKPRSYKWALLSAFVASLIFLSAVGIYHV